jgi:uncharacterized protein (TIGR00288 family)
MERSDKIAVLVDGDNAQSKLLKAILEEVSKYGKVTVRRIYGDWTTPHMNSWKAVLNDLSFTPMQKFSYTTGKNSTDSSLIIDAMDILHDNIVDGFCIVSSDSDYTGLAKRIREEGIFVMGIGEKKTPNAFIQSCEVFTFTENIISVTDTTSSPKGESKSKAVKTEKINMQLLNKAFEISANDNDQAYIATLGSNLRKLDPSFDVRAFGYKTLTQLISAIDSFVVTKSDAGGHLMSRKK